MPRASRLVGRDTPLAEPRAALDAGPAGRAIELLDAALAPPALDPGTLHVDAAEAEFAA
jgi:hypothetical protein